MELAIIAAVGKNGEIGIDGKLPWRIPEDLARFKRLTEGNPVIMGRVTYESLPKQFRPLPNRMNIVLSTKGEYFNGENLVTARHIEEALWMARNLQDQTRTVPYVMGGSQIYRVAMSRATRLEITHVNQVVEGADTYFPLIDPSIWIPTEEETCNGCLFATYRRRQ